MNEETTSRLEETLRELKSEKEATDFINEHQDAGWKSFSDYYTRYLGIHDIRTGEAVSNAGFGEYAYQIICGRKQPVSRDHVISLCIAAGMSVKETNRALRLSDHFPLNPKDERDVRIVVCINNGLNRVIDVNLELDKYDLPPLE